MCCVVEGGVPIGLFVLVRMAGEGNDTNERIVHKNCFTHMSVKF
jgi:hypothetical protein